MMKFGVRNAECGIVRRSMRRIGPRMDPHDEIRSAEFGNWRVTSNQTEQTHFMNNENLKRRTKQFALAVIKFVEALPKDETSRVIGRQLLRSGTSVGANYRSACRAKSTPDFISKLGNVEEEADESGYWLELLVEAEKVTQLKAESLIGEASELVAISVSSINTSRKSGARS
jgi:four helix bundle protein